MKTIYRLRSIPRLQTIVISLSTAFLITACAGAPPTAEMAVAKVEVNNADAAGANEFAPLPYRSAQEKMEGAHHAMAMDNYEEARRLAEEAEVDAQLSAVTARSVKAQKAVGQLQQDNNILRQEIDRKTQ